MESIYIDRKSNLILHLVKSCENYDLSEKESLQTINKILDKGISRRTYYNYKKKLYDKDIFKQMKGSIYDTKAMRCLLLDLDVNDRIGNILADKLVSEQVPNRKDIFHDIEKQKKEIDDGHKKIDAITSKFDKVFNEPIQKYQTLPKNSTIKKEYIKCGKAFCLQCPHGSYYYAYWRDNTTKKLKKKYLGVIDLRL